MGRQLQATGALLPLNSRLGSDPDLQPGVFFPAAQHYCASDGNFFGLPLNGPDADCILINVDMIAEVTGWPARDYRDLIGWPSKAGFQTWQQFTTLAMNLTKKGVAGFQVPNWASWLDWWAAVINSNGTAFYRDDAKGLQITIYSPNVQARMNETVTWLEDLIYRYRVSPRPSPSAHAGSDLDALLNRSAVMVAGYATYLFYLQQQDPTLRVMAIPIPQGPYGKHKGAVTFNDTVCINRYSQYPIAAWDFMRFLCSLSTQVMRLKYTGSPAPHRQF
jgi:ABC-type glycerol-3-phosphate transport system substrate-binding protein